ncbi:iron-sulfur cluster assembly scaffold protein [Candidatus Woesearchaeota archaeon]|nr:iron-sulfur cluster assembly scaffold protein [Candidatus Woesearchaeota archaeon]
MEYSEKVKKHFLNPSNLGKIEAEGLGQGEELVTGEVGNPACGDLMKIYVRIKNNKIIGCKVETFGCAAAIACSSVTTELAIGKTIEEAKELTRERIVQELDGLPPLKLHCSNLAVDALKKALENYEKGINVIKK